MIVCMIGATEIILISAVILLLFGGKKLPELMKGMGKGVKSFKEGMNEPSEEEMNRRVEEEVQRRADEESARRTKESKENVDKGE
ncbi:MAG: twin-arginine translocase TatA/TatE family subunit [Bacteroidales bacterium]|nr:twin-arginine translocase TatA/TatE family subunit [Bacteroidales bacterium]MBD5363192.1 twin-arginine translocase TatA/TatE family subunit [Bacteroides sp.]MBD5364513.1 twin-arginine translocase TatA/TatE family subunit [Bacteroides sp.]